MAWYPRDIAFILARDPAARHPLEVLLTYPGYHAMLLHRVAHALWQARLKLVARVLAYLSRLLTGIEIHPAAVIGAYCFIDHGTGVVIGETAVVGDRVTLYQGATLGGVKTEKVKRHPTLGNDVMVGAGARLLGPISIGDGAKIGANAVVLGDVPAGATYVGVPARAMNESPQAAVAERVAHLEARLAALENAFGVRTVLQPKEAQYDA